MTRKCASSAQRCCRHTQKLDQSWSSARNIDGCRPFQRLLHFVSKFVFDEVRRELPSRLFAGPIDVRLKTKTFSSTYRRPTRETDVNSRITKSRNPKYLIFDRYFLSLEIQTERNVVKAGRDRGVCIQDMFKTCFFFFFLFAQIKVHIDARKEKCAQGCDILGIINGTFPNEYTGVSSLG